MYFAILIGSEPMNCYGDVPKWLKGPHSKCGRSGNWRESSNLSISAKNISRRFFATGDIFINIRMAGEAWHTLFRRPARSLLHSTASGMCSFSFRIRNSKKSSLPYMSSYFSMEILPPAFWACPPPEPIPSHREAAS